MRLSLLAGIYADAVADFVTSYPVNREPVAFDAASSLSEGYLRAAPGITGLGVGPGADRGGINWNGAHYRVMGTSLVRVAATGACETLGDVGPGAQCSLDYSFDNLIIGSGGRLYYWNEPGGLRQVTDPDLGYVEDAIWTDGYTMTTDGEYLVVTDLNDPMAVNPIKYGSSEEDPDPILGLIRIRGEVYALNRNTIEVFSNVGGDGFPYQRNSGALIPYGCVGTHAKTLYSETFAFIGSARNEAAGVFLAGQGTAEKLSTRTIDNMLAALSADDLASIVMEARVSDDEARLLIHLPDKTLVFFREASRKFQTKVWAIYASGVAADKAYRGRNSVLVGGQWFVADASGNIGVIDPSVPSHFGETAGYRFDVPLIFVEASRGIIQSVTLTGLPGRVAGMAAPNADSVFRSTGDGLRAVSEGAPPPLRIVSRGVIGDLGIDPVIFMSYSTDGVTYGQQYPVRTGRRGDRNRVMQWRKPRRFDTWITLRFNGADLNMAAYARVDAVIEQLRK